jgi:hypothetical protein
MSLARARETEWNEGRGDASPRRDLRMPYSAKFILLFRVTEIFESALPSSKQHP